MSLKLQFLGAAQTVTGSRTLLEYQGIRALVDCGLFQGPKPLRLLNWEPLAIHDPLSAVILTHAHIDHSGYLPKLVKSGFDGPIYATPGTIDLCRILLTDSAYLQEEDASFANRTGYSHHKPALPLYTVDDVQNTLRLFRAHNRNGWRELSPHLSFRFLRAGHIIGASIAQFSFKKDNGIGLITFTGDLGNKRSPTLTGPDFVTETDYLVIESTYGNRLQPRTDHTVELAEKVKKVMARNGVLLIPAFSVGRAQDILFLLRKAETDGLIPEGLPVYLDSPMSSEATRVFIDHPEDHRLVFKNGERVETLCPSCYKEIGSANESIALTQQSGPMIVISAAGMLTGGRIMHHLKARLPRPENAVLFVGYQAEETKGRLLQDGIKELRIHHKPVTVNAEIMTIESLSAHADLADLIEWVGELKRPPKKIFINHGEAEAAKAFAKEIQTRFGYETVIPSFGQEFNLE